MAITRSQQARQMLKKGSKPVVQGGVDNYLGKQPQVVAPRNWQSGPDKPPTELAYITEAEKKLLLKEDIHGSLKDGPNKGPAGIMSLDSFGDIDDSGQDVGMAGGDVSRAESGDFSGIPSDRKEQAKDIRAGFVAAGGGQETKEEKKDKEFQKRKKEIKKTFSPLSRYNRQRKRSYIDYLKKQIKDKINKGLIDYQTEEGQITGLTDFDTLQDYIDRVQSVDDLVASGFYSKDGRFAKGAVPDFPATDLPGGLGLVQDIFKGPVTKERLNELLGQVTDLTALETGPLKNLQDTNIKNLMEEYEPNRFKREYGDQRDDRGPSDPCLGPNPPAYCFIGDKADETMEAQRNLAGLTPRIGGSIFDFTGLADGGIADLAREEMFLGGIVRGVKKGLKGITRGIKKVAKSPIGKLALAAAAGGYGFGLGPFKGLAGSGFLKGAGMKNFFLKDAAKGFGLSNLSGKGIASLIGGASLLPLLMGAKEEDEFDIEAYYAANRLNPNAPLNRRILGSEFSFAEGGSTEKEPVATKTLPLLDMGGQEMDLRAEGGFVPIGRMEKADDVPARLSKNEFVFTAEAVRNAGDGDVDKGAEVMYNMMKNLEDGGDVSEESQGLEGARNMFQTSQRLGEVL